MSRGDALYRLFGTVKPVIGMIHLRPLPGSPRWGGEGVEEIIDHALRDLEALVDGGVDGVIIENFHDMPFKARVDDPETIAAFTVVAWEVKRRASVPVGLNLLRNSGVESMAIACVIGADFIRVNAYSEPLWSSEGLLEPIARDVQALRKRLNCRALVFSDVNSKHSTPILDLVEAAKEAWSRGLADALIVSGSRTGEPVDPVDLCIVHRSVPAPLLIGSGARPDNIGLYWRLVDGFIVGTYFKRGGRVDEPVDPDRVRRFMDRIRWFRKKYG